MHSRTVLILAFSDCLLEADRLRRRLADAWYPPPAPNLKIIAADELNLASPPPCDAAIVVASADIAASEMLPVLAWLEESALPVMAVLSDPPPEGNPFSFSDCLVEIADTPPPLLAALLYGMLHRQRDIDQLRREVDLAQRFHGGLRGEITRIQEELQLAAVVQREFLPRHWPTVHAVSFAALWRPAHYVSGDIYDIVQLDDDHVGLFIADAVGHGVPAALMTMVICKSLTTSETQNGVTHVLPPSEVMQRLNEALIRQSGKTPRFATAVYAVVNCRERVMRLAGAGHPPALLLPENGPVMELNTDGGLLGVFEDEQYPEIEVELAVDDRVIFYSDGFEQAFPEQNSDAYQRRLPTRRYRQEFEALVEAGTPTKMIESISTRLDDQCGSLHQIDDLTLVCMHAGELVAHNRTSDSVLARSQ